MSDEKYTKINKVVDVDTREDLEKHLKSGIVVLDWSATWCGPCKRIASAFENLASVETSVKFLHADIDELSDVSNEMGISSVPTFLFFKDGKKVGTVSGANITLIKETLAKLK